MDLFIERNPSTLKSTSGKLYVDGVFWLPVPASPNKAATYTLEDVVREVAGEPVEKWKIKGQTAIPAGRYRVDYTLSRRFKKKTLILLAVPGFDGIRFHGGNKAADTVGCIICGQARTGPDSIAVCKPAITLLESIVCPEIAAGREVWCTVENAPQETVATPDPDMMG